MFRVFFILLFGFIYLNAENSTDIKIADSEELSIGSFCELDISKYDLPPDWKRMSFTGIRRTQYQIVEIDGKTAVKAVSENSSSGLVRETMIDLKEFPVMRWTWRAENIIEKGNVHSKDGDDYPARIYVLFDYSIHNLSWGMRQRIRILRTIYGRIPTRGINYIWDRHSEVGTIVENPYTDLVNMVVVESGEDNLGKWVTYERNIYNDYLEIYGVEPPKIEGVAIMTDSDDTGESAVTYYGNITFLRE
jgi:hypothetical protein